MQWQRQVVDTALERDPVTGLYVYDTVTVIVGRRAGKTRIGHGVPLTRALLGPVSVQRPNGDIARVPFIAGMTAQNATSAIKRLSETYDQLRENAPPAVGRESRMLHGVNHAAIELRYRRRDGNRWNRNPDRSRLAVFPPTPHAVRGDKYLFLSIDEALTLTADDGAEILDAARPTLAEFAGHAQLWIISNEGTESAGFLRQRREMGRAAVDAGRQTGTAYFEWSMSPDDDPTDPEVWRRTHPAVGETLTISAMSRDLEELGTDAFAREYLNHAPDRPADTPPLSELWPTLPVYVPAELPPRRVYAFEVAYDRSAAVIMAAWQHADGIALATVDRRPGVSWLETAVLELARHHKTDAVIYDAAGPAANVGRVIASRNATNLIAAGPGDPRASVNHLLDLATAGRLTHDSDPDTAAAAAAALTRTVGDNRYWDRRRSPADISPIIAASLAVYAADRPATVPVIL
jgi:hypothetical protein